MILLIVGLAAIAQPIDSGPSERALLEPVDRSGQPELDDGCPGAEIFGGSKVERAGYCVLDDHAYASLRTLATKALVENPASFRAHYLMGVALHAGEGNLPKARFHLTRSEELFVQAHGMRPADALAPLLRLILIQLVNVHGEMDAHAEKIAYVDKLHAQLGLDLSPLKAWPLMKLGRYEEARSIAKEAAQSDRAFFQSVGKTALCAVESEQRNRQAAYDACLAAARRWVSDGSDGAVELTNAGAASEEMLKLEDAERYYLAATSRPPEGSVNPYGRLVLLYLRQARYAEAVSALSSMDGYRARRPGAQFAQQDEAESRLILATTLLLAGRIDDAEHRTERAMEQPDRKGTSSASSEQAVAGAALLDRAAKLARAAREAEHAAVFDFDGGWGARARSLALRWSAWRSGLKAREVLTDPERLFTTFRPEVPGSVEGPEWLDFDAVGVLGPGVVLSALERGRAEETLPPELSEPIFQLFEAEARALQGRWRAAFDAADVAARELVPGLELMRARAHARRAQAAEALGRMDEAAASFAAMLETDPGLARRLDMSLPVSVRSEGPVWSDVAERLLASPRFRGASWGLQIELSDGGITLRAADGRLLRHRPWTKEALDGPSRALAAHDRLLVPTMDLSQVDLRSLDGAVGGAVDADAVLDGLLQQ